MQSYKFTIITKKSQINEEWMITIWIYCNIQELSP